MRRMLCALAVAGMFLAGTESFAAGGDPEPSKLSQARADIEKKLFTSAERTLKDLVASEASNAEAWNLLGYSVRKQGRFDEAEGHYQQALKVDDDHVGAMEYLGMLYVQTGRIEDAKTMLARIDDACFFTCDEQKRLEEAITTLQAY